MRMIQKLKKLFCKRISVDYSANHVWLLGDVTRREAGTFARAVAKARREKQDLVVSKKHIEVLPADKVEFTLVGSREFKSKRQLMRAIGKAIGTDWENISELLLTGDSIIRVVKYYGKK